MSKVSEFYAKAVADESAKKELITILGDKKFTEASDDQLAKIGELAKRLGFEITIDEAKAHLNGDHSELDEEELDAVAGGKQPGNVNCNNGVGNITVDL